MNAIRTIAVAVLMLGTGVATLANDANAECHNVVVYKERPSNDQHHVVGTAIGAVAGAVIGHQFGGGSGKALLTAGGAVAGGAVGHHVASDQSHRKYRTVERVCKPDEATPAS